MSKKLYLKDGDKVAVVGAGPSGTLFAKFLTELASRENKTINITLFDGKRFDAPGPRGCNMCAGVIAETLVDKLEATGIRLPDNIVQRRIDGYKLITTAGSVILKSRLKPSKIVTVFRGCGPVDSQPGEWGNISFDEFLLECVRQLGVDIISKVVWDVKLPDDKGGKVLIGYGTTPEELAYFEADAVVVACGLNSPLLTKLQEMGFGYKPPKYVGACQTELRLSKEYIDERFKQLIHVYSLGLPHIKFAALVPKQKYLTVTMVGDRDLNKTNILEFLHHPLVRKDLPSDWEWETQIKHCMCTPRIPLSGAVLPFSDRICIIGDAAYSRLYKNGLESALLTSKFAAEAMWNYGLLKRNFLSAYYPRCKKDIVRDNSFGRIVFWINDRILMYPFITQAHLKFARNENITKQRSQLRDILWSVLTGDLPYRKILLKMLNPSLQLRLNLYTAADMVSKTKDRKNTLKPGKVSLGPLQDSQIVVIIGGGPSGSACAISLLRLAAKTDKKIRVLVYEPKDFEVLQNQCVGVLSPPSEEILKEKLGIELPPYLIQKRILSYILYSRNNSVCLQGEDRTGPTYAIRRSEFDRFLLENARELGAELIQREVTDIEFYPEYIRVFSGSYNHDADVVVGAFGINNADILELLESETKYTRPNSLKSVITNIYADEEFINHRLNNTIHTFIPPIKNVEFAAITPKHDHITVNICGVNVSSKDMNSFLRLSEVRNLLPHYEGLVYFKGSFPISPAREIFRNRFVLVGDSGGLIRPLKGKGINSAIITGVRAAETIMNVGISKEAFSNYYNACHDLIDDTHYGIVLRNLCNISNRLNLLDRLVALAKKDLTLYRAFYNIVSGHQTYKRIVKESVSFNFLARLAKAIIFG